MEMEGEENVAVGAGEVGIEFERLSEGGEGVIELSKIPEEHAKGVVCAGILGAEGNGFFAGGDGFVVSLRRRKDQAQVAAGVRHVGFGSQSRGDALDGLILSALLGGNQSSEVKGLRVGGID